MIAVFDQEPDLQVLNGRYGPYISYKKQNYKIPKGQDATNLTLDDVRAIVADEANASKSSRRATTTKKAASAKKTATKKTSTATKSTAKKKTAKAAK